MAGLPVILPVNYTYVDGDIVFRTGEGTKLHAASNGAVIAFEIDEYDARAHEGWSVLAVGRAEHVTEPLELAALDELRPRAVGRRRTPASTCGCTPRCCPAGASSRVSASKVRKSRPPPALRPYPSKRDRGSLSTPSVLTKEKARAAVQARRRDVVRASTVVFTLLAAVFAFLAFVVAVHADSRHRPRPRAACQVSLERVRDHAGDDQRARRRQARRHERRNGRAQLHRSRTPRSRRSR